MTIIDWMNQLLVHKKHWNEFSEDEQKKFSPFIINRWLSMDKDFIEIVNQYGMPIAMAGGMGYFIYFIWKFVTTQIKPKLGATFGVLVALIDRIRMLDNDLIRLDQKLNIFIEMDEEIKKRKKDERLD